VIESRIVRSLRWRIYRVCIAICIPFVRVSKLSLNRELYRLSVLKELSFESRSFDSRWALEFAGEETPQNSGTAFPLG